MNEKDRVIVSTMLFAFVLFGGAAVVLYVGVSFVPYLGVNASLKGVVQAGGLVGFLGLTMVYIGSATT